MIFVMFEVKGKTDTTAVKETWRKLRATNTRWLTPDPHRGGQMNIGHEHCWRSNYTPSGFAKGGIMPHSSRCDRAHMEAIRADDGLGTGPVVADYCQCCDAIIRRGDFA